MRELRKWQWPVDLSSWCSEATRPVIWLIVAKRQDPFAPLTDSNLAHEQVQFPIIQCASPPTPELITVVTVVHHLPVGKYNWFEDVEGFQAVLN